MKSHLVCPHCGRAIERYQNPAPTADTIIQIGDRIVLVERKVFPFGWAIPGGFVEYGETLEKAAVREAKEETDLDVRLVHLLGVYSDPSRDPRKHTVTTVFVGNADGEPKAADEAKRVGLFHSNNLPEPLAFDHRKILEDYFQWKNHMEMHSMHRSVRPPDHASSKIQ